MTYMIKFIFYSFQSSELSVFETNIRFVGGLLALYALTGDKVRGYNFNKGTQLMY